MTNRRRETRGRLLLGAAPPPAAFSIFSSGLPHPTPWLVLALALGLAPAGSSGAGNDTPPTPPAPAAPSGNDPVAAWPLARTALLAEPGSLRAGNAYRQLARRLGRQPEARALLDSLATAHPALRDLQVNRALADLDRLGATDLDAAGGGVLAQRAARRLTRVLDANPTCWPALYARALCHLLWPANLHHTRPAIHDLERCLLALEPLAPTAAALVPVYRLLGDAQVKRLSFAQARETYQTGLVRVPRAPALRNRLELGNQALKELVETSYGLAQPPDTDLSPLWAGAAP